MIPIFCRYLFVFALLVACAGMAPCAAVFYTDQSLYNAALTAAHLSTNTIDFESVPTGDYSTASGLTVSGLNFVGPFVPYFLHVYPETTWGVNFSPGTGNTLAGVGEIDIKLPANVRAFGANMGESFVWAAGGSSTIGIRLSTGEQASTPTNPSRLFPFFGFLSDVPVSSLQVGLGASFITIDNVTIGATATTPEPATKGLLALAGAVSVVTTLVRRKSRSSL